MLEDTVKEIQQENKNISSFPDTIETNLEILIDLFRKGHVQKEELNEYIKYFNGRSELFDLIFNDSINKLNDIELLMYLDEQEIDYLLRKNSLREDIYKLFEKRFFDKHSYVFNEIFSKLYQKNRMNDK